MSSEAHTDQCDHNYLELGSFFKVFASVLLPLAGNLAAVAFDAPRSIFVLRANKTNVLARDSQR